MACETGNFHNLMRSLDCYDTTTKPRFHPQYTRPALPVYNYFPARRDRYHEPDYRFFAPPWPSEISPPCPVPLCNTHLTAPLLTIFDNSPFDIALHRLPPIISGQQLDLPWPTIDVPVSCTLVMAPGQHYIREICKGHQHPTDNVEYGQQRVRIALRQELLFLQEQLGEQSPRRNAA